MKRGVTKLLMIFSAIVLVCVLTLNTYATGEQYFTSYPLSNVSAYPGEIVANSDGNLWFTEQYDLNIGRITPSGTITEFPTPEDGYAQNYPVSIAAGSDGALWFTSVLGHSVYRMTTDGTVTQYPVPNGSLTWSKIIAGPDGALWFSNWSVGAQYNIGRISTDGTMTAFPTTQQYGDITRMTFGSDNALWMTRASSSGDYISRMTTSGAFSSYALPTGAVAKGITAGPDGALWFTEYGTNSIGRITTSGVITQYPIPHANATPTFITTRADGTLWFVESSSRIIGNMTTDGTFMAEYNVPYNSSLLTMLDGPDGALWFTNPGANLIGRFEMAEASTLTVNPTNGTNVVGSTAVFQATATNSVGFPVEGAIIRFTVSGSTIASGTCETDSTGVCTFTYNGPQLPGADVVDAFVDTNINTVKDPAEPATTSTQAWLLPTTTEGQITGGGHIAGSLANDIAFGFVAKSDSNSVSGSCSLVDPSADTKIHCSDATIVTVDGNNATIFGNATVNGEATIYRIDVQDIAKPGAGDDTFSIVTQSGYSANGTLTAGNIKLH